MNRVVFLADHFSNQNTSAILYPLFRFRRQLLSTGLDVRVVFSEQEIGRHLGLLVVTDRYLKSLPNDDHYVGFSGLSERAERVAYFDTGDSSGLLDRRMLEICDLYLKPFILQDRACYETPHYGGRLFTDYYHRRHNVGDECPIWSDPVSEAPLLAKLRLAWSPALFPYDVVANRMAKIYARARMPVLLKWPRRYFSPKGRRPVDVSCRMSMGHKRDTVVHQRKLLAKALDGRVDTGFVSRRRYAREMRTAKAVISPFGWGEYALRDYEAMVSGAALIKPDMGHLETWPDIYRRDETYLSVDWDLNALSQVLDGILSRPGECREVAQRGQAELQRTQRDGAGFARHVASAFAFSRDGS